MCDARDEGGQDLVIVHVSHFLQFGLEVVVAYAQECKALLRLTGGKVEARSVQLVDERTPERQVVSDAKNKYRISIE